MESSRILVIGFPDGTTKAELTIYFQSERDSGGGDVQSIEIDRGQAVITFERVEAAARILRKGKHYFKKCPLLVSLLPELEPAENPEYEEEAPIDSIEDEERPDENGNRFEDQPPGRTGRSIAEASASSQSHNSATPKRDHRELSPSGQQCTVLVRGIPTDASEDLLTDYFENARRSKGGPVSKVDINCECQTCLVTFESPDDALRTVKHSPHKLGTSCLDVSLIEATKDELPAHSLGQSSNKEDSNDETDITIIVSGILPSEDALWDYFENKRKSGGGEILKIDFTDEEDAVITFAEVKDLTRLLEGPHSIDDNSLTVIRQPPKKKVPLDPFRIHVKGINETGTSKDHLQNYLEKFADADVYDVYFGCNNNAFATFETEPDFTALFDKVNKDTRGLQGSKLELERVPICTCIQVSGLKKETSYDAIELYFESEKKAGGNRVVRIQREENSKDKALVYFDDPSSVQNVVKRSHVLDEKELEVKPHYPYLENTATKQTEITFDADIFDYIKMNHDQDLQTVLEEYKVQVEISRDSLTIFPSEKKGSHQLWQDRAGRVELFLRSFMKIEVPIAPELFDEITRRWVEQNSIQDQPNYLVAFNAQSRSAQIVGKKDFVIEEELKLKELISAAERDTELMKSVVEVTETDFQRPQLILLEMSGICERLQNRHPHLSISFDVNGEKLYLNGPVSLLQEVRLEVYKFITKVNEQTVELPTNLINVLKRPQVLDFTQNLLKQKGIQALFFYNESKGSNEVQVVGVDSKSVKEAEIVLKNVILEKSLQLTQENTLVLEGRDWKEFHLEVISKFKVGIFAERSSSSLWVGGIANDVEECYKKINDFFDANTILHGTLPLDHGTTRFIVEKWSSKLDEIKKELATCYLDIRASSNGEGIEVSGTAEGLKKCITRLQDLAKAVQEDKVPIDKPGMKKLFLEGKGPELLKSIEYSNRCVILTKERNENKEEVLQPPPNLICSYLTQEAKTISVFKGDITNHRVDAIVNAANENLRHGGGLAGAIVRAGGQEIQTECDKFTRGGNVLLEGRTLVTTAGKLPCDKVIHTVGPKWDPEKDEEGKQLKERVLKYAITNCLQEARSLRTIAIPAVSSGVYGFPRDLCARVILDAVLNFCKKNPLCTLKEIHLVNIDDPTVSEFEKEMRKRFAGEETFTADSGKSGFVGFRKSIASRRTPRSTIIQNSHNLETPRSAQNIRITVKVGDLATEKADVLVGTAASSLNLEQNPCALALSKAAGPSLQQQCSRKGPIAEGNIAVIENKGNLDCKAVFFAVCSPWNDGKGVEVLKRLLTKCLEEADNANMESIAFAAIGTGNLKFPREQVAKIYFNEVITYNEKNPKTTLKDVRFVLYEKDTDTIQAFHSAEQKSKSSRQSSAGKGTSREQQAAAAAAFPLQTSTFSPVKEMKPDHLETTVGPLCFQVQPGDITQDTTDAIAVLSNCNLEVAHTAAGNAILQAGGNSIMAECSRSSPQSYSSVTVIKAGQLKARHLYLIVPAAGSFTPKNLEAAFLLCLQEAEKRNISSISFPAIGTGNMRITAKSCALSMLSAIRELSKQKPASLKFIKMTIFEKPMIKDFRLAMFEESGTTSVAKRGIVPKGIRHGWEKMTGAFKCGLGGNRETKTTSATNYELVEVDNRKIDLLIVAGCKSDLQKAINAVNGIMKETCKQQVINHRSIESLTKEHMQIINTLALRYSVNVTVEKEVNRIVVDGQSEDILQVVLEMHKILNEVEKERSHAEVLSEDIRWMHKFEGKFEEYDSNLNAQIELAYRQKKPSVLIEKGEEQYEIDFGAMAQVDELNNVIEVRRIDLRKDVEFPVYWCPQPTERNGQEETVHLFQLDPVADDQEYKKVSDQFLKSSPFIKIIKIERVQNPALYETYEISRQRMEKVGGSNEMYLFHGTKSTNCELINHKGFNRSFCGENGAVYGNGVYFAINSSYSARSRYAPPDAQGRRYMYLAKVLVGEYTQGRQGLITPPPKNLNNVTDTYDTVVDKIANPSIVVVFYDWQCYPEYLITFQGVSHPNDVLKSYLGFPVASSKF